ncbi:MAG TPA: arylmalonate decarboxylase [Novosphingobium sp.]|nr:arylmalonate decarboxylase [Novosphingobium sp.]
MNAPLMNAPHTPAPHTRQPDALAWRARLGVIGPATNTIVEPDFAAMCPPGVTNHHSRIPVENASGLTDADFIAATDLIGANTLSAVRGVMPAAPDHLVMGMSAVTFYGGLAGAAAFEQRVRDACGLSISVGSSAIAAALRAYGGIARVAFLSPYFPSANAAVKRYLAEAGFETVRDVALQCDSWRGIAQVPPSRLVPVLRALDGDDVDAICQIGTNLSMVRLAAEAERWLGKPVIAINTATYWHALRAIGITDRISGFGRLLEEF